MNNPTPEQIEAAAKALYCAVRCVDASTFEDWPAWVSAEKYREDARAVLVASAGAAPQEQQERVEARLREVVYLCDDGLICDCEEARDGAARLARELSIVAAGEPAFTTARVWALARALHDEAGDSDNVAAFAASLAESLRVAGIPFDEVEFVERGYLLPTHAVAPVLVDEAKLAEVLGDHYPGLDQTACYDGGCGLCPWKGPEVEYDAHVARDVVLRRSEWLRGNNGA